MIGVGIAAFQVRKADDAGPPPRRLTADATATRTWTSDDEVIDVDEVIDAEEAVEGDQLIEAEAAEDDGRGRGRRRGVDEDDQRKV